eukprot:GDKJ01017367.1.p1 GENE.GDKJ01017367.1~~GDKJ01017367.1.p1  ORF type:complete len:111 (-),score=23.70 GDKJ01017367.1:71-403(-)
MVNQKIQEATVPLGKENTIHTLKIEEEGIPPIVVPASTEGEEYAKMFYKRSNAVYGTKISADYKQQRHVLDSSFTDPLRVAGMYRNHSLNTHAEPERYMDGSRDWMLKIV